MANYPEIHISRDSLKLFETSHWHEPTLVFELRLENGHISAEQEHPRYIPALAKALRALVENREWTSPVHPRPAPRATKHATTAKLEDMLGLLEKTPAPKSSSTPTPTKCIATQPGFYEESDLRSQQRHDGCHGRMCDRQVIVIAKDHVPLSTWHKAANSAYKHEIKPLFARHDTSGTARIFPVEIPIWEPQSPPSDAYNIKGACFDLRISRDANNWRYHIRLRPELEDDIATSRALAEDIESMCEGHMEILPKTPGIPLFDALPNTSLCEGQENVSLNTIGANIHPDQILDLSRDLSAWGHTHVLLFAYQDPEQKRHPPSIYTDQVDQHTEQYHACAMALLSKPVHEMR